jgi:hypothetical protein
MLHPSIADMGNKVLGMLEWLFPWERSRLTSTQLKVKAVSSQIFFLEKSGVNALLHGR